MIELSDKNLLELFDKYGQKGIKIEGKEYPREGGETPKAFIDRVRRQHGAWQASQKAQATVEDRGSQDSDREKNRRSGNSSGSGDSSVQTTQAGLEESIEAQVSRLGHRKEELVNDIYDLEQRLVRTRQEYEKIRKELSMAEEFLERIKKDRTPDVEVQS